VLVTTGGGSLRSPQLRAETDQALDHVLDVLAPLAAQGAISTVLVVPGADATVPRRWAGDSTWLQIAGGPVPLTALYCRHDLLITRAGRNTLAEAEQQDNAAAVAALPSVFTPRDWHDHDGLRDTVLRALEAAARGVRSTGWRGNAAAADLICGLVPSASLATGGAVL
jgi:hypothetical protein